METFQTFLSLLWPDSGITTKYVPQQKSFDIKSFITNKFGVNVIMVPLKVILHDINFHGT